MKGIKIMALLTAVTLVGGCASDDHSISSSEDSSSSVKIDTRPVINVCIIAGQSNAVGNGYLCDIKEEDQKDYPSILYYGNGDVADKDKLSYVSSIDGKGNGTSYNHFGMEVGMADTFVKLESDTNQYGIIKCAYNGSSIVKDVSPERGDWNVYDEQGNGRNATDLIETIKRGIDAFEGRGYRVRLMGCAWMQGEADYATCNDYDKRMMALISLIRKETGYSSLPFALGELAQQNYPDKTKPFYKSLEYLKRKGEGLIDIVRISEIKPRCTYQETGKGKYGEWDFVHWSGYEMIEIGNRFADTLINLDEQVKKSQ